MAFVGLQNIPSSIDSIESLIEHLNRNTISGINKRDQKTETRLIEVEKNISDLQNGTS